jgi:hypothetical protein
MMEVRIADNLDLGEHEAGYGWKAGDTRPRDSAPGWWGVRKGRTAWVVIFRSINGPEYTIQSFSLTTSGERAAKVMALKLVDIAWGRGEPRFR